MRKDIEEDNEVHCLAFASPLMDFDIQDESGNENYGGLNESPSIVRSKNNWKKIYKYIMDKRTHIPIKEMAWKSKHQELIFQQM